MRPLGREGRLRAYSFPRRESGRDEIDRDQQMAEPELQGGSEVPSEGLDYTVVVYLCAREKGLAPWSRPSRLPHSVPQHLCFALTVAES